MRVILRLFKPKVNSFPSKVPCGLKFHNSNQQNGMHWRHLNVRYCECLQKKSLKIIFFWVFLKKGNFTKTLTRIEKTSQMCVSFMSQQKLFGSILVSGLNFEQFVENLLSNYVVMTTLSTWLAINARIYNAGFRSWCLWASAANTLVNHLQKCDGLQREVNIVLIPVRKFFVGSDKSFLNG